MSMTCSCQYSGIGDSTFNRFLASVSSLEVKHVTSVTCEICALWDKDWCNRFLELKKKAEVRLIRKKEHRLDKKGSRSFSGLLNLSTQFEC